MALNEMLIPLSEKYRTEILAEFAENPDADVRYSLPRNRYVEYDKPITIEDIQTLRSIGRKSINNFTSEDIEKAQKWAYKFYQQLGEKSPFFRAWFGDWRAYDKTPIVIANKKGDARGLHKNTDTGWNISISRKVFNETVSHNGIVNIEAKPYLPFINDIVRNAVLLDTVISNKENQSLFMHTFYAIADIGKDPELLKLYVEELNNPNSHDDIKRAYQLQNIEKKQFAVTGWANKSLGRISQTASVKNIADLFSVVKQKDKNFTPKPVDKHLLNEDGTPKKFYHGTNAKFTEFSKKKAKSGFYGKGFYFSTEKSQANVYGKEMEIFLRTRICVSKKLANGRILLIETVSKSRGSIQFKNAIGLSEEKYAKKFKNRYKKTARIPEEVITSISLRVTKLFLTVLYHKKTYCQY